MKEAVRKMEIEPHGVILKEDIEKEEEHWMKKSNFEIDVKIAQFDVEILYRML